MERMRDVLRRSLAGSLRDLSEEDRLAAAWPVACGAALAGHAEVLHLDPERTLHIRVTGAQWLHQFQHMRSILQHDLARIAGVPLHGIHFEEQGRARPRPASTTPSKEPK